MNNKTLIAIIALGILGVNAKAFEIHVVDKMDVPEYLLKSKYPQEYAAIKSKETTLKEREEQLELLREKVREDYEIESEKVHEMFKEYQKTQDPKILELMKAKLEEKYNVKTEFYYKGKITEHEAQLQKLQERLANAKVALQATIDQKDAAVNAELDNLCNKDFYWSMH